MIGSKDCNRHVHERLRWWLIRRIATAVDDDYEDRAVNPIDKRLHSNSLGILRI